MPAVPMLDSLANVGLSINQAAGALEIVTEGVIAAGQSTQDAADKAAQSTSGVNDATINSASFSQYPPAQQLASHYGLLVPIFVDTLEALRTDVNDFGETIVAAAKKYDEADEETHQVFTTMAKQAEGVVSSVDLVDKAARARAGAQLPGIDDISVDEGQLSDDARAGLEDYVTEEVSGGGTEAGPSSASDPGL